MVSAVQHTPPRVLHDVHQDYSGGIAASRHAHTLRAVRQFVWLEVDSVKRALSHPGRAPGWCPIPPTGTPAAYAGA